MSERATFDLAVRLRQREGAPLGEVFAFLSGLYFRGKLAYGRAFASPPEGVELDANGLFVITPNAGLRSPDTAVTLEAIRAFAGADYEAAVVLPEARKLLSRFDSRSVHYDTRLAP